MTLLTIPIDIIQPSQFFVDEDKVAAVGTFVREPQDIVIQVLPWRDRYVSRGRAHAALLRRHARLGQRSRRRAAL